MLTQKVILIRSNQVDSLPIKDYVGNKGERCIECGKWIRCHVCGGFIPDVSFRTTGEISFCSEECDKKYHLKLKGK